jgi:hypothetical protein
MNSRLCTSVSDLRATMQRMAELIPGMVDEILHDVVEKLYLDLVGEGSPTTPIKTGRARTGWVLDTQESEWVPPNMDDNPKSHEEILSAVREAIDKLPVSATYFLSNNVPYILRLERGHSKQAPHGFIAIALANMAQVLRTKEQEFNNAT